MKLENIGHLQSWNVLDTPDIMCTLLPKLPGSSRDKWSRNVLTMCRRHKGEPDFIHIEGRVDVFSKEKGLPWIFTTNGR